MAWMALAHLKAAWSPVWQPKIPPSIGAHGLIFADAQVTGCWWRISEIRRNKSLGTGRFPALP